MITPAETEAIRLMLKPSPRLSYIFECGMRDLSKGINDRRYHVSKSAVVMHAEFSAIHVFYVWGKLLDDDIRWIFSFGGEAEIHCPTDQKPFIESKDDEKRISSFHLVRYYVAKPTRVLTADPRCRLVSSTELETVQTLLREQGDQPVFYDDMKRWPAFAIWEGNKLVSYARTIFLDEKLQSCQLGHFLTHPDFRGRGYAKALGRTLMHDLQKLGVGTFRLDVYDHNPAACRAYEALGFHVEDLSPMAEVTA